jgi:type III secretory pathway component EscU
VAGRLDLQPDQPAAQAGALQPLSNLGRLFSGKHLSEFGLSLFKVGVLLAVLWHVVRPR